MKLYTLLACTLRALAAQPSAPAPIEAPLRPLPWGQLNFLHTTDTHGWHGGHLLEPSYSADWGDYISFAHHLRKKADDEGVDLLLIDTGDRVEGNGLYDASEPKGKYSFDIIKKQKIDIICSGNHELYKRKSVENEFWTTVPNFKDDYLASNIDFYNPKSEKLEALASRYKKFTTKNQGIRITAFGFLYNFHQNANNSVVKPVEETIKEQWFVDAIKDHDVDLFVVIGHVAVRSEEFDMIYKAIRKVQWDTPIQFFGGHTHIRDYKKYDSRSYAIESGRFMETIGFMSISGLNSIQKQIGTTKGLSFGRRYIDNNLFSFHSHTSLNKSTFPTELGLNITAQIAHARKELDLDHRYGCAPEDLWLGRSEASSNDSIFNWLGNRVLVDQFTETKKNSTPRMILANTGAMRFDIFKGPFTTDTKYQVSPFTSGFRYIRSVPYKTARRLLEVLNSEAPVLEHMAPELDPSLLLPPQQRSLHRLTNFEQGNLEPFIDAQIPLGNNPRLIPGYTTVDDAGSDGDDTEHAKIRFYKVPNCIQTVVNFPDDDREPESVDVFYNEFLQPWVFLALQFLGEAYDIKDSADYLDGKALTEMISDWVREHWKCE